MTPSSPTVHCHGPAPVSSPWRWVEQRPALVLVTSLLLRLGLDQSTSRSSAAQPPHTRLQVARSRELSRERTASTRWGQPRDARPRRMSISWPPLPSTDPPLYYCLSSSLSWTDL